MENGKTKQSLDNNEVLSVAARGCLCWLEIAALLTVARKDNRVLKSSSNESVR